MSLRLRLTLVFAVATAVVLATLAFILQARLATQLRAAIDRNLGAYADTVLADAGTPRLGSSGRFVDPDEAFAQLLTPTGGVLQSSPGLPGTAVLTPEQVRSVSTGSSMYVTQHVNIRDRDHRSADTERDADRLLATPITLSGRAAILVVGQTLSDSSEALNRQLQLILVALPVALIVMTTAGWLLAGAALRPVESMRRRAAQLSAQDHAARLPVPRTGDELARLAVTLNDLLDRLHRAVEREHRFVDDASHELRTPLAILKAELDLALARPRSADQLRSALHAAATHTDELVRLAEDLLVLARMRGGALPLHRNPTDLRELLVRAVDPLRQTYAAAGRELRVEAPDVQVDLDPLRTRQAILNLLDNALRHGRGTVTVTARTSGVEVTIEVCDQGDGFPPELGGDAFEPFTRGAPASSGARGAGLGLAIVRAVAAAHGGRAYVVCSASEGAVVRLELLVRDPVPAENASGWNVR